MAEEAKLKVTADASQARQELGGLSAAMSRINAAGGQAAALIGGAIGGAAGAVGGQILGGLTGQALAGPQAVLEGFINRIASNAGLRTGATGPLTPTDSILAGKSAREATAQAFGLSAAFATDAQIKAVYGHFAQIEGLRLRGSRRIDALTEPGGRELGDLAATMIREFLPALKKTLLELGPEFAAAFGAAFGDKILPAPQAWMGR
jgi:hypothetical protein